MLESLFCRPQACNFIKKETLAQVFSCEFCKISKNTFFTEQFRATASSFSRNTKPFSYDHQVIGKWNPLHLKVVTGTSLELFNFLANQWTNFYIIAWNYNTSSSSMMIDISVMKDFKNILFWISLISN